jgi:hypothetical protein
MSTSEPVEFRTRRNVLEDEMRLALDADTLVCAIGGATLRHPFREISQIRLWFDPTRFDSVRCRCEVKPAKGERLRFPSTSYVSIGDFEDRGAAYARFVRALVARVAAANPAAQFHAGKRPLAYYAEHAFLLSAFLLLGFVLATIGEFALSGLVMTKLAIIAFYVPIAIAYTRRNWPRRFSAAAIPTEVLPDSAAPTSVAPQASAG